MTLRRAKVLDYTTRQKIAGLVSEIQARGLEVPDTIKLVNPRKHTWPKDSNGYFPKIDGTQYNPTKNQDNFIKSQARFSAFIGGRGSGKSCAGSQKALIKISNGMNGAVINPDFENFKVSTWPEFREWIPWQRVVASQRYRRADSWQPHQPFVMVFENGAKVICKGLKDADSARGPNINWLWYDEAGRDRDGLAWKIAIASVRVGYMPQAWITTTPKGKDTWIYEFFVDQKISEEARELFSQVSDQELIDLYFGSIYENQENLDPGFMASMLASYPSGWLRDQEINGLFVDQQGVLGNRAWFDGKIIPAIPSDAVIINRVRYWDLAATEKKLTGKNKNDPDETVGTRFSMDNVGNSYIEHQACGFVEWTELKGLIATTAEMDGVAVKVVVEQEPGSGGKNQVAELDDHVKALIPGHPGVEGYRPEGDRVMLANIWFAEAAEGKVYMIQGSWNTDCLDQLSVFPEGRHDDKITSISGARINCAPITKRWKTIEFLHL